MSVPVVHVTQYHLYFSCPGSTLPLSELLQFKFYVYMYVHVHVCTHTMCISL